MTQNLSEEQLKKKHRENLLDDATKELNEWTGDDTAVEIHLFRMFSEVFKRHNKDEADALFIVGTKRTTPSLDEVSSAPVKPWVFSRVLALLGLSFALLTLLFLVFHSDKAVPGMVFIGSLAVPFSLAIMFFEINVYKNISVFQATEVFLIGGIASLVATMVLYQIIPSGNGTDLGSALAIGFIEETAKLLIIGYFINSFRVNYIFNGMLIGACVGAGFAVFETSGYTGEFGLVTLFVRSWQAIGTHTIWSAIIGAAIILAKVRHKPVKGKTMVRPKFLRFYLLAVLLHACWDWQAPAPFLAAFDIQKWLIIIAGWIAVFVLIDAGLREVRTLQGQRIIN
ncbi:PrsW family intramembrane metalloprotease [Lactobacillus sp. LC28-10]|uniref:PrsW family intramembrane metalloprotease n=1 Tax=Secundilactobacillus angelensis TaxID=2722706 RepID=A0ABX1KZF6_9LACO|nr:PrsW family glutamic-type intramembrane protease [Secundilactobacillus angelensis]MCH5462330.1 PrsW family glutamic-type intramembrane protease [Secundilactobacillus angelensis]NLR18188.1 PrsW family intramembrane metalloprotease [Secundilactobacillus angelensis]